MLATLVYLADEAAENFCWKVTLDLAVAAGPAGRFGGVAAPYLAGHGAHGERL